MNKAVKILTITSILLLGLVFSGCAAVNNAKEALSGPKDTWFRKEITYTNNTGSVELVVYMCYSDNGYTSNNLRSDETVGPGLTLVVINKSQSVTENSIISGLVNGKYLIKTFSNSTATDVETGTDDGDNSSSSAIKMSEAKWNLIYNSVTMEKQTDIIAPLHKDNQSVWAKIVKPDSFSWKKILANYLLDRLLED